MFFAISAAPTLRASNGDTCLYSVPTVMRSSSESTGQLIAPGIWSSAKFCRRAHVDNFVKVAQL